MNKAMDLLVETILREGLEENQEGAKEYARYLVDMGLKEYYSIEEKENLC